MNKHERIQMVRSMDMIIRNLNDESYLEPWLMVGVEDHNGDLTEDELEYYCEDTTFADLMRLFCRIMNSATNADKKNDFLGTLYCDGILSKKEEL